MELLLKNIGKIKESKIKLDGITVIAGENNSGKSTVGRVLFTIFNSLYRIDEKIKGERDAAIYRVLYRITRHIKFPEDDIFRELYADEELKTVGDYLDEVHGEIIKLYGDSRIKEEKFLSEKINEILLDMMEELLPEYIAEQIKKMTEGLVNSIKSVVLLSPEDYIKKILKDAFHIEFKGRIRNFYVDEKAEVSLKLKDNLIRFYIQDDEKYVLENIANIFTKIIYIDNPFVLDTMSKSGWFYLNIEENDVNDEKYLEEHEEILLKQLARKKSENNTIEAILIEKRLEELYEKLNEVCSGSLEDNDAEIGYREKNSDFFVNVSSLSTGIKSFLILKTLLLNGTIGENGTIVLDEPEIHLHPEWQVLFAEIIVLLQKEFHLHVLLTTHSPYFVQAIEVYSEKYGIKEKCHYYLAQNEGKIANIKEVTEETEKIYSKLARPFQELENERYSMK